jgi:hypothetical protein
MINLHPVFEGILETHTRTIDTELMTSAVSVADEVTRRMIVAGLLFDSMTVTPGRIAVHVPKLIFDDTCAAVFRGGERTYMSHLDGELRDWWDCNGLVCAMRVHVQAEGAAR